MNALRWVGDTSKPDHQETGRSGIYHVQRLLTVEEREAFGVGDLCDVRDTDEERRRLAAVFAEAPYLRAAFKAAVDVPTPGFGSEAT